MERLAAGDLENKTVNTPEKQSIHELFESEQFAEHYLAHGDVINEMLCVETREEFEDFLSEEGGIDERAFWLYYDAVRSESLLIGGYEGDVTHKVSGFLRKKLPENLFSAMREHLQNVYVDMDGEDDLKEKIGLCSWCLDKSGYSLKLDFDDTYCAGVYFLSVVLP